MYQNISIYRVRGRRGAHSPYKQLNRGSTTFSMKERTPMPQQQSTARSGESAGRNTDWADQWRETERETLALELRERRLEHGDTEQEATDFANHFSRIWFPSEDKPPLGNTGVNSISQVEKQPSCNTPHPVLLSILGLIARPGEDWRISFFRPHSEQWATIWEGRIGDAV